MSKSDIYEIRIQGQLDSRRSRHLEGMIITHLNDGVTLLIGPLSDQAALYGLLSRLRDLGLPLLSVIRQDQKEQLLFAWRLQLRSPAAHAVSVLHDLSF